VRGVCLSYEAGVSEVDAYTSQGMNVRVSSSVKIFMVFMRIESPL